MDDYTLVLNAGSSSLKFCVYERPESEKWRLESRGQIESIGAESRIFARDAQGRYLVDEKPKTQVRDTREAVEVLAAWLGFTYGGARVVGVGHRVVHGGARYAFPTVVTPQVFAELRRLAPLAPLHQPQNLAAIEAVSEHLPRAPQVACFDTSFHRNHAPIADLIPLPREICGTGLRRYGFHGLFYEYITSVLPRVAPRNEVGPSRSASRHKARSMAATSRRHMLDCKKDKAPAACRNHGDVRTPLPPMVRWRREAKLRKTRTLAAWTSRR